MPFLLASDMQPSYPLSGWNGAFFSSKNMTFGIWEISADAAQLHEHSHPEEEVWNVVEGRIAIAVDGEERIVRSGDAVVIPANTPHSARPLGYCRAVVVDHPVRTTLPGVGMRAPAKKRRTR
jgi:mannose-6-phosphate isomerase-like protein (cupin superfamily)